MDQNTKITMVEVEKFGSPNLMEKVQRIKSNPRGIQIDRYWISRFLNPMKINKNNAIKINDDGKNQH